LPIKKEYRGARSSEAFTSFIKEQLVNPMKVAKSYSEYSIALMDVIKIISKLKFLFKCLFLIFI
jgi:hypothetical protein